VSPEESAIENAVAHMEHVAWLAARGIYPDWDGVCRVHHELAWVLVECVLTDVDDEEFDAWFVGALIPDCAHRWMDRHFLRIAEDCGDPGCPDSGASHHHVTWQVRA
jgi:hypothetical protein